MRFDENRELNQRFPDIYFGPLLRERLRLWFLTLLKNVRRRASVGSQASALALKRTMAHYR